MSTNHHAAKASELVIANQTGGTYIDPNTGNYMAAQVEATLALAYEQRTANLIALWIDPNANESPLNGLDYGGIAQQIQERLGLA